MSKKNIVDYGGSFLVIVLFIYGVVIIENITRPNIDLEPILSRHETEVAILEEEIHKLGARIDFNGTYQDERCACLSYGSVKEEPVTLEQICNYDPEEWGHYHSRLYSWEKKEE